METFLLFELTNKSLLYECNRITAIVWFAALKIPDAKKNLKTRKSILVAYTLKKLE